MARVVCVRSKDSEAMVKRMESSVKEDQSMLKKLKEEEGKHSVAIETVQDALNTAHHTIDEARNAHEKKSKEVHCCTRLFLP